MSTAELSGHNSQLKNYAPERPHEFTGGVFIPDESQYTDLDIPTECFNSKNEYVRIGGAIVKFTVEVPEEIRDPYPIIYAHGYCSPEIAYSDLRNATARNGKIAITYQPPRTQNVLTSLSPDHSLHPERLLAQAVYGVMRKISHNPRRYKLQSDRFDLSGHSMGGRSVTKVAEQHPGKVRTVILNEAAGLYDHNTLSLIGRLPYFGKYEAVPAFRKRHSSPQRTLQALRQGAHYVLRNPYKTLAEGIVVSNCNIQENVRALGASGIKTSILVGESDMLISAAETAEQSADVSDLFALYSDPNANHLWPMIAPLETAQTHQQILARLHA